MRRKSCERRRAILSAAAALFREHGADATSMATITETVGGSKATIYNYFKSKDDLIVAVFVHEAETRREGILDLLSDAQADLRTQLIAFGAAYLTFLSDPEFVASARSYISTTCSASSPADLADRMYENGPQKFWREIGALLAVRLETGDIQPRAQCCLTLHLKALLHAEFGEALLFGARPKVSALDASVVAVDAFLMLYGSERYRERSIREHDARMGQMLAARSRQPVAGNEPALPIA